MWSKSTSDRRLLNPSPHPKDPAANADPDQLSVHLRTRFRDYEPVPRRAITAVFVHPTVVVHRGEGTHLSEIVQLTDPSKSDHHRNWKTALSCQKASGNPVARSPGIECQRGLGSPQEALHRDRSPSHRKIFAVLGLRGSSQSFDIQ